MSSGVMYEAFSFSFQTRCSCPQTLSDLSMFVKQALSSLRVISSQESRALLLPISLFKQSRILEITISQLLWAHSAFDSWENWGSSLSMTFPQGDRKKNPHSDRSGTRTHWKSGFWSHTNLGSTLLSSPRGYVSLDRFLNFSEAICKWQKQCQPHRRIMRTEWTHLFTTLSTVPAHCKL